MTIETVLSAEEVRREVRFVARALSDRDIRLLFRLIDRGETQEKVALVLGVSRRTIYRYLLARKVVAARLAATEPDATGETE